MDTKTYDKLSARTAGFVQAAGVAGYITLFALTLQGLQKYMPEVPEIAAAMFMLTAFVFSALFCGSLVLGYPSLLALGGKTKRAVEVLFWSGATLLGFLLIFGIVLLILG